MEFDIVRTIVSFVVLAFSVIVHEVAHGYVAYRLGDDTAREHERITLNPLPHIDIFGTIILPLILSMTPGGVVLGWAKPVPVNPIYFRNPKQGMMWVSLAGPASNLGLAILAGMLLRFLSDMGQAPKELLETLCLMNIGLAVFNLVPIPPLDGSKVLAAFLPTEAAIKFLQIESFGFIIIYALLFIGLLNMVIWPIVVITFRFLTGI
ncbi:MAG: site-2 protease family protein [Verrucomicrobia bacterium]|nr:site-2 protease family protein [Verrucomicrobiota bacterium]